MNQALRRDEFIRTLEKESAGSFYIIQRALADVSRKNGSNEVDLQAVISRIHELLHDDAPDTDKTE